MKIKTGSMFYQGRHDGRGLRHAGLRFATVLAAAALLAACGGGGANAPAGTAATVVTSTTTTTLAATAPRTLSGRVLSSSTGEPVPGAAVTVQGVTATADTSGNYTIDNIVLSDRVLIALSASGFASTTHIAFRGTVQNMTANASLIPVAASQQIDPAAGGTASVTDSTAAVVLPANGLVRADGNPVNGNVTIALTPVPVALNSSWISGDYTAIASGQAATIDSFGAIKVTLKDAQGAQVNLATGQSATIRIPLSSRSATVPATLSLFYFDDSTGRWVQEGTASLVGSGSNRYYEGTVTHFTTWNAGRFPAMIPVTGCLMDANGVLIPNGVIKSDGIDYSGTTSVRTDSNGHFSLPIASAGRAIITGHDNDAITNTLNVGPSTTTVNLGTPCMTLSGQNTGINIKLTWGTSPTDLDTHLIAPNGVHISYGNKGSLVNAPYMNLDVDDVTSYGPEVLTFTRLQIGTYQYYIHNFSSTFNPGITGSPARVELNIRSNTWLYTPPAGEGTHRWWQVFNLTVDADCNITVTPVGTWSATLPTAAASTANYCAWVGTVPSTTTTSTTTTTTRPGVPPGTFVYK